MNTVISTAASALLSFILAIGLIPVILIISHQNEWFDRPNHRKIHTGDIPRLGGVGFFLSFLTTAILAVVLLSRSPAMPAFPFRQYLPLAAGMLIIHVTGLLDDFKNLPALLKFFIQLVAAFAVCLGGVQIHHFTIPGLGDFNLGIFAYPMTIVWIVGIMNAINLIDGMDGLAGSISAIALAFLAVVSLLRGNVWTAIFCAALFGGTIGFLAYNFPPAKIFMGDSGALFLGFMLASLPLVEEVSVSSWDKLFIPMMLLLIPILDTASAIFRRLLRRQSIMSADKEHIHHKFLFLGFSNRKVLLIVILFGIFSGVASLLWVLKGFGILTVILTSLVFVVALTGLGILTRQESLQKARQEKS